MGAELNAPGHTDWVWAIVFAIAFFGICLGFGLALGGAL